MGTGECRGEVGAPEPSEQGESPNKTYLFHLRSVCALHGRGRERPRGLEKCLKDTPPWRVGMQRAPTSQGGSGDISMQVATGDL